MALPSPLTSKTRKGFLEAQLLSQNIHQGFDSLACQYDRFNDWITFGLHRVWKKKLLQESGFSKRENAKVIDLCCGSGDIALLFSKYLGKQSTVVAVDFSLNMLSVLKRRLEEGQRKQNNLLGDVQIKMQDVSNLRNFSMSSFQLATMGFGLRNLPNRHKALKEIYRILGPKGRLLILDVGKVTFPLITQIHSFYFEKIVPRIGYLLNGKKHSMYAYLPVSARAYPNPNEICVELEKAGFAEPTYKRLLFGSAVIHMAVKKK